MNTFEEKQFEEFKNEMKKRFEEKKNEKTYYKDMINAIGADKTMEDLIKSAHLKWHMVLNSEDIEEVKKHLVDMANYCRMMYTILNVE